MAKVKEIKALTAKDRVKEMILSYTDGRSVNWHTCFWKVNISGGSNQVEKFFIKDIHCSFTYSGKNGRQTKCSKIGTELNELQDIQRIK